MFDHVTIRVSDRAASRRFYERMLAALGMEITHSGEHFDEWRDFSLAQAGDDDPVTRGLHAAFVAPSRQVVDDFWRAAIDAGYRDDGAPGPRPEYHDEYYGAFVLDPDGNSVEAVYHGRPREGENWLDHLWLRVADLAASRRFYETIAPQLGLRVRSSKEWRFHVAAGDRSFALVVDGASPTERVHLAFPARDRATVDEFHRLALGAGYRDNGSPGERPQYHAGYYGAYLLDPEGHNVEAVFHDR